MSIDAFLQENRRFSAPEAFKKNANIRDGAIYQRARKDRLAFWEEQAEKLHWFKKWDTVLDWQRPYAKWFIGGELNAAYNCLDVHIHNPATRHKAALIWEGERGETRTLTYFQLYRETAAFAFHLRHTLGVHKGDRVTIYMPMIPELVVAVLACARIGAIHSVVFGGFSAQSLRDRIADSRSKVLITADGGYRRGKVVALKQIADEALKMENCPVEKVVVVPFLNPDGSGIHWHKNRDVNYTELLAGTTDEQPAEVMDSEDTLFILYTSGTTGKPKGIMHTTGGYLTHARYSTHAVFDLKPEDVYWCTADIGWITGHTYVIYGPLSNGATVFMYEGAPDFPHTGRFWELIQRHCVSVFYTAPTAIRTFMKWGDDIPTRYDLSSLRLLGSVGEPINPEAWVWYYTHIGRNNCPVVDTWWQTETGGIMISNLPALNDMRPGHAGLPLPGIEAKVLEADGTPVKHGGGLLSLTQPWPSMLRGVWGDPQRYEETYWSTFETYFAGDGARLEEDGYFLVVGRVDDVLNVAGHRIGTMEVESTVNDVDVVCESAVVGMPDDIKGQAIVAFVILEQGAEASKELEQRIIQFVSDKIGAIARPKRVIFTPDLPKTRSGKIMRRILKDIVEGKPAGDMTTLANPDIVEGLRRAMSEVAMK